MLVFQVPRLVYFANPKTATQSTRAMLAPYAPESPFRLAPRHMNSAGYERSLRKDVAAWLGGDPETFAVMREPRDHMESWFRYRQRDKVLGRPTSTHGLTFADFVTARLAPDCPPHAKFGRQDRFLGFSKGMHPFTYVFDYSQLPLLVAFLSDRFGVSLSLPKRNRSPKVDKADLVLPKALEDQYRAVFAEEFALYDRVARAGMLETRP